MSKTISQSDAVKQAVDVILQSSSYYFSRAFLPVDKNRTAVNIVNRMFESEKELESTLLALSLMPVMVWMQGAEDLDKITERLYASSQEIELLVHSKALISDILDGEPAFVMERRKEYFKKLHTLVDLIIQKIDTVLKVFPENGARYADMLGYFYIGRPAKYTITAYTINLYLPDAIRLLDKIAGEEIRDILEDILKENQTNGNEELQYIYHNISLLLSEYSKIVWTAKNCDDKAVRLLGCKTEEEMLALTESDAKYYQAYIIVQYIVLIHNAIVRLKSFPQPNLYPVINAMISGKRENMTDSDIALGLNIPLCRYRQLSRMALAVLSAELFGLDCGVFIDILTDC